MTGASSQDSLAPTPVASLIASSHGCCTSTRSIRLTTTSFPWKCSRYEFRRRKSDRPYMAHHLVDIEFRVQLEHGNVGFKAIDQHGRCVLDLTLVVAQSFKR